VSSSDDKAFDEYLGRESQVSQRYRALEADAVPEHLDAKVLAQAKDALAEAADELSRVRSRRRRLLQWSVPAAVAASALLVVSIVIRSGTQHEITPVASPSQVSAPPPPRPMESPAAKPERAEKQQSPTVVMIAPPRDAVTEFSSLARAPASESTARSDASNSAAREEAVVSGLSSGFQTEPTVPLPAAAPPSAAAALAREQDSFEERSAQRVQDVPALQAKRERQTELEQVTVTSSRPVVAAQDAPMAISSVQAEDIVVTAARRDPALWLEYIRELRRDGKDADADEEWKQFREAYPEHPVGETDIAREQRKSQ
jgi:hypothetical protein